ncbi:single-stranded-DNA-specific exonuclease RecJ [Aliiglaciecola sp. CAU 1673]|uniref:single-stranded-DNA-specific exonuclease RecJ n=1 Tax=Aliiglaciecola sp. CAU 1673 TaxID=3032595 RepID=UPI0023DCD81A|nr:single-stranded-DNA-specific exonuclease RecJ [Aliiglaciecola sp. CAU 1673]MDF2178349.1 single-stranded-DNA-specific exonuclease RecJ [Aliiglaciecola sp. CAU 1673]
MKLKIKRRESSSWQDNASELPARLQAIYAARGVDCAQQLARSNKDLAHYQALKGIDQAVQVLACALEQGKALTIIGDFDADGATSTALCMLALKAMGANKLGYLVPNRFDFGYGLSPQIVELAHRQGAEVLITVDNGIACLQGAAQAKALGLELVITDHHLPASQLPDAEAIVNPNLPGCDFPSKHLAGVGVAFYLMLALCRHLEQQGWFAARNMPVPKLVELLDLVALGTVADVVRLDRNNRILVHQGLQRIRSGRCRPGILAMLEVAGRTPHQIQASDLGFVLGPRLNAAGRLEDMALGIECLLAEDTALARSIAIQLDSLNRERREIESGMQAEALQSLETLQFNEQSLPAGLVLYQPDWHQGVIGILAGRIKDKYFRPTIAFAHQDDEVIKGSARSIPGLHIRDLLEEINSRYPGIIDKFGGHAMAAGLSLKQANLPAFEQVYQQVASEWLAGRALEGEIISDGELEGDELTLEFAQLLKDAGPWGQGFEEPLFDGKFELVDQRLVGDKHLKMMVRHPAGTLLDAIAFNVDLSVWPNRQIRQAQLAYKLDINHFRGKTSLQLLVDALAPL